MIRPIYEQKAPGLPLDRGWGPGVTTNPERDAALGALSDVLSHGYVLNATEIGDILSHYGYSPNYARVFLGHHKTSSDLGERGVSLTTRIQGKTRVYEDGSLLREEKP
jgi:hypothetical protein